MSEKVKQTNNEAIAYLRQHKAGIYPDLSRKGYRFIKRVFDVIASGVAILVLFIPALILCAVIYLKSPGAGPFYTQWRVGRINKDGSFKIFRMWKFRSMIPYADEMLASLQDANEADGPLFKIKDDPRIIPGVGTFIRKHSIDELPQLLNVFIGDMSLIGPRPALPVEVVQYSAHDMERLTVKCGCGGIWQTTTRSDSTFNEMIDLDLEYIKKSSISYDLSLIVRTIKTMLTGGGAY